MKVIIAGTRTVNDYGYMEQAINESQFEITRVLCGTCRGADMLGHTWANGQNIPTTLFMPDWKKEGKKAGVLRNQRMVNEADALIVLWDGQSKGTADVIRRAEKKGIPIYKLIIKTHQLKDTTEQQLKLKNGR